MSHDFAHMDSPSSSFHNTKVHGNNICGRNNARELLWAQGVSFFLHLLFEKKSNVKSPTVTQHYTLYISAKDVTNQTLKGCHILFSKILKAFGTGSASNACEQSSAHIRFQAVENLFVLAREE